MACQAQKDKYHMILSHVGSKTVDLIEIRSRMVGSRGGVGVAWLEAGSKLQSDRRNTF